MEAIQKQVAELDFAGTFQMGHPKAFEAASRLVNIAPEGFEHVFFTNSVSEAVDTALKIAIAYHRAKGNASKVRLIGRERGYHGVNFGGISVGGISPNRKKFGACSRASITSATRTTSPRMRSRKASPNTAQTWPTTSSASSPSTMPRRLQPSSSNPSPARQGVLIPPKGYLSRLAAIAKKHDILLIFDEVITGFGRLGTNFAADYFGVSPDMITTAKGVTNGTVPMGCVFLKEHIHDAFMQGPEEVIDFSTAIPIRAIP